MSCSRAALVGRRGWSRMPLTDSQVSPVAPPDALTACTQRRTIGQGRRQSPCTVKVTLSGGAGTQGPPSAFTSRITTSTKSLRPGSGGSEQSSRKWARVARESLPAGSRCVRCRPA